MAKSDDPRANLVKQVDQRLEEKNKAVEEYYRKQEGLQPTPTQRENDLAKVGALDLDEKEDDGSEWDTNNVAQDQFGDDPYQVRDLESGSEAGSYKRRGRPAKNQE